MEGCGDSPWVQNTPEKILEGQGLSLQMDGPTRSTCRRNPARLSLGKGSLYRGGGTRLVLTCCSLSSCHQERAGPSKRKG